MNIALDYDNTYTRDRKLWDDFIEATVAQGHRIYIITLRSFPMDNNKELTELSGEVSIIFCNGFAKQDVVSVRGIHIDIWIDDLPGSIVYGSRMSEDQVDEWRRKRA